ncbi:glycosyltransferase family 4 protein [Roseibium sp.]|uniref:glycosyltransferase family 4 protein n=1 Tax=Roseibium sp. TaxID=1936156 RepID=UPI003A97CD2E
MPDTRTVVFAYPGDLETPTGGYAYDRRIIDGLRQLAWNIELLPLGDGYPMPDQVTLQHVGRLIAELPQTATLVVDGLAFGCMAEVLREHAGSRRFVALVHHPLCMENGMSADVAARMQEAECKALSFASEVIVTSDATALQVVDMFGISRDLVHTIYPGTDRTALGCPSDGEEVRILSVGTIVPRKGYDLLFQALGGLKHLDWHLDIVGDTSRDLRCFDELEKLLSDLELSSRVTFHGAVASSRLSEFYRSADFFALASNYEGYGMAYTEALSHGLPVVGSGEGAVRDTLNVEGALYCETGDLKALAATLGRLICDRSEREHLRQRAFLASRDFPTWEAAAKAFGNVLEGVT